MFEYLFWIQPSFRYLFHPIPFLICQCQQGMFVTAPFFSCRFMWILEDAIFLTSLTVKHSHRNILLTWFFSFFFHTDPLHPIHFVLVLAHLYWFLPPPESQFLHWISIPVHLCWIVTLAPLSLAQPHFQHFQNKQTFPDLFHPRLFYDFQSSLFS